jgi:hypothetical protein
MTEGTKDWRKKAGGYRVRLDEQGNPVPRARGGVSSRDKRPGGTEDPGTDRRATARALYEGVPGTTCESVAKETGVPVGTVRRWKATDDWKPARRAIQNLSARAGELANSFKTKMTDLGKPLSDEIAAAEAAKELSEQFAVDVRAQLIDRHRKEWSAPRKIIYEAVQSGDLDKAKLGKIAAETLMLIQTGECRAYGMDQAARGADAARTVVVIDRDGAETQEPEPAAQIERAVPDDGTDQF